MPSLDPTLHKLRNPATPIANHRRNLSIDIFAAAVIFFEK
jgi:hypothetical protein